MNSNSHSHLLFAHILPLRSVNMWGIWVVTRVKSSGIIQQKSSFRWQTPPSFAQPQPGSVSDPAWVPTTAQLCVMSLAGFLIHSRCSQDPENPQTSVCFTHSLSLSGESQTVSCDQNHRLFKNDFMRRAIVTLLVTGQSKPQTVGPQTAHSPFTNRMMHIALKNSKH